MAGDEVVALGLSVGATVRFRRRVGGRWHDGVVEGLERDGSVSVRDGEGRSRSLRVESLEVKESGPRGAVRWVPVRDVAARTDQLTLDLDRPVTGSTGSRYQRRRRL